RTSRYRSWVCGRATTRYCRCASRNSCARRAWTSSIPAMPSRSSMVTSRLARIPVVVHSEHGRTFPEQPLRAMVQRLLMRGVDAAFAVSAQLRADLVRELGIDGSRMEVLYNGVDTGSFRPLDAASQAGASGGRLRIGSVGRLVPVKNYGLLLSAFARLPPGACQLILVGEGPERGAL